MEAGDKIEKLIAAARDKSVSEKQLREQKLETRREAALTKIGEAAVRFGVSDEVLEARIGEASAVRISQTEAYALLASRGDLTSPIMWWEIRVVGQAYPLWKGYVIRKRQFRKRLDIGVNSIEVNVREVISESSKFVAECFCNNGKVVSVGVSEISVEDAIVASIGALKEALQFGGHEGIMLSFLDVLQDPKLFIGTSSEAEADLTSEEA